MRSPQGGIRRGAGSLGGVVSAAQLRGPCGDVRRTGCARIDSAATFAQVNSGEAGCFVDSYNSWVRANDGCVRGCPQCGVRNGAGSLGVVS